MPLSSRRDIRQFVHRKLLFRLRRLAIIFLIIAVIVVYEVLQNYLAAYLAAAGFAMGVAIGLLVARRMHTISWDVETSKAITKMDRIGILILVLYLLFSIARHWIFSFWFHGSALGAFTLSIAAGGMLGRFYTTRQAIRKILKAEGKLGRNKL
jgi:hypothetical protein